MYLLFMCKRMFLAFIASLFLVTSLTAEMPCELMFIHSNSVRSGENQIRILKQIQDLGRLLLKSVAVSDPVTEGYLEQLLEIKIPQQDSLVPSIEDLLNQTNGSASSRNELVYSPKDIFQISKNFVQFFSRVRRNYLFYEFPENEFSSPELQGIEEDFQLLDDDGRLTASATVYLNDLMREAYRQIIEGDTNLKHRSLHLFRNKAIEFVKNFGSWDEETSHLESKIDQLRKSSQSPENGAYVIRKFVIEMVGLTETEFNLMFGALYNRKGEPIYNVGLLMQQTQQFHHYVVNAEPEDLEDEKTMLSDRDNFLRSKLKEVFSLNKLPEVDMSMIDRFHELGIHSKRMKRLVAQTIAFARLVDGVEDKIIQQVKGNTLLGREIAYLTYISRTEDLAAYWPRMAGFFTQRHGYRTWQEESENTLRNTAPDSEGFFVIVPTLELHNFFLSTDFG